jgi:hypothetical protein
MKGKSTEGAYPRRRERVREYSAERAEWAKTRERKRQERGRVVGIN